MTRLTGGGHRSYEAFLFRPSWIISLVNVTIYVLILEVSLLEMTRNHLYFENRKEGQGLPWRSSG